MTENEIKEEIKELHRKAKVFEDSGYATAGISATFKKSARIIYDLLTEREQYKAIGTIEEFKALKEKSVAKKPISLDKWGEYWGCPSCGKYAVDNLGCKLKYCRECGTRFDWS